MIAIGIALLVIAFLGIWLFGSPGSRCTTNIDYAFVTLALGGIASIIAGVIVWAWRNLP